MVVESYLESRSLERFIVSIEGTRVLEFTKDHYSDENIIHFKVGTWSEVDIQDIVENN